MFPQGGILKKKKHNVKWKRIYKGGIGPTPASVLAFGNIDTIKKIILR